MTVRVAVRVAEVADAPRVDDPLHVSQDEEERFYRHYGITFSRENSESLLRVVGAVLAEPERVEPALAKPALVEPALAEPGLPNGLPMRLEPAQVAESTWSPSPLATDAAEAPAEGAAGCGPRSPRARSGCWPAVAAAVFWWRRRQQLPPTRKELLAARARAASLALATRKEQVGDVRRSAAADRAQALRDGGPAGGRAGARGGERQPSRHARRPRAAAVAAAARTVRLQRTRESRVEPQPVAGSQDGGRGRR